MSVQALAHLKLILLQWGINMYRFDPVKCVFYSHGLKEEYLTAGNWPENGVDISDEERAGFMQKPGFFVGADKGGNPVWIPEPPQTKEQLIEQAEAKKQFLISEVHTETEMLRAKLALGRIKDDEKALLITWLDYLDELEAVDVSTASDIIWPVKPKNLSI
ncbi:tail fiber assembly protein [Morganella morganii]